MQKAKEMLYVLARPLSLLMFVLVPALILSASISTEDEPVEPDVAVSDTLQVLSVEEGEASYYGYGFAGRLTASGEIFNPDELTAAHPSLPMDTQLRVTNLDNDRTVNVRVNDRGPFAGDRVLDLSKRAAQELQMVQAGHAEVRIEVIE